MRFNRSVAFAVRVVLATGLASPVLAADPADEGLEEVVVTAQFREQNLQQTPLAITAVSAELLESRNQTNITEITMQAPNVSLKPQGAAFGPSIAAYVRGIGQTDFNPAVEPGVGMYVDDVYFATLTGAMMDLLDLDRVEVLRGPQGTLAGRNSIGGAVKLYSKKPKGDDSGFLTATYGSRNRVDVRGSADVKISDTLFARFSGVHKRQDGYIQRRDYGCDFPASGVPALFSPTAGCVVDYDSNVNYSALRAALRWLPNDALEFNLAVDYTNDDRNPTGTVLLAGTTTVRPNAQPVQGPGGTALSLNNFVVPYGSYYNYASYYSGRGTYNGTTPFAPPSPALLTNYPLIESRAKANQFFDGYGVSLTGDWTVSDSVALKSITAYREYDSGFSNDNDLSPLASSLGFGTLPFHSISQELRLNGAFLDTKLEYTLGGFYMKQRSIYESFQDLRYTANYPLQFQQNDVVNADTQAVFGHLAYHFTDKLTLTGGVRYTEEHKDYTFTRLSRDGTVHPFLGILNGQRSDYDGDNVDYRANVQYEWTDSLMTYVQYATGFKGGGTSPRPFVPEQLRAFNPEKLDSYEAGLKTDLFDRKLRLNGAVFYSEYTDLQLGLLSCPPPGPAAPCGVIANAGDAEIKGAELEVMYRPFARFAIDASYSYLDFEYTTINPLVGGPGRPNGIQFTYRAPYTPERKWSIGAQYEFLMGDFGSVTPRVDWSYQGDLYTNGTNGPSNYIQSYTMGNARVTWRAADEKWEAALEVTNLADKYYLLTRTDQLAGAGHSDGQPGRPREWAITLKRKFQ